MGMSASGELLYGVVLYAGEEWLLEGLGEYGELEKPWHQEDGDVGEEIENALLRAHGFTETDWQVDGYFTRKREAEAAMRVGIFIPGHHEFSNYVLGCKEISAASYEMEDIDPAELAALPVREGWDERIAWALDVLDLTPSNEKPGWILTASYG